MRTAIQDRPQGARQTVQGAPIPAPVGGWNARDPLAGMAVTDAATLDNWIPRPGYVETRRGCLAWVTGLAAAAQSMLAWRGNGSGNDKVFVAAGTAIYDATGQGAVGASVYSGLSTARVQYCNFATNAGNYIVCVTGGDTPFTYNGTTWATSAITGISDSTKLIDVMAHKTRLWFTEVNSLHTWYLPVQSIAGAATLLDLGSVADKGGTIAGAATWTLDGGNGPDDYAVWFTTNGQAIIYKGTDPSSATTWALVGVFDLGRPLGRRALLNAGAELIVLTADGAIPLSQALAKDRAQDTNVSITAKIQNAFAAANLLYGTNFGWEAFLYPNGQLAIFNVPVTQLGVSYQYVQNLQTGAWCRFTGLNAYCWVYANSTAYFGGATATYKWDTGSSDNGTAITCDVRGAYTGLDAAHSQKQFKMIRPLIIAPQTVAPALDVVTDYRDAIPLNVQTVATAVASGAWDSGLWDTALWADVNGVRADWTTCTGVGYVGAARMRVVLSPAAVAGVYPEIPVQLIGFDVMYQVGGML